MVISHQRKLLFIHIPKCAGESITEWLLAPQNGCSLYLQKHDRYADAEQVMGGELNGYLTFSVVRNPFEQVLSFYEHLRKPLHVSREDLERQYPGSDGRLAPQWASRLAMEMDFPDYVRTVYAASSRQKRNAAWFDDMLTFLSGIDGRRSPASFASKTCQKTSHDWPPTPDCSGSCPSVTRQRHRAPSTPTRPVTTDPRAASSKPGSRRPCSGSAIASDPPSSAHRAIHVPDTGEPFPQRG